MHQSTAVSLDSGRFLSPSDRGFCPKHFITSANVDFKAKWADLRILRVNNAAIRRFLSRPSESYLHLRVP
jgi:hypothetical protein